MNISSSRFIAIHRNSIGHRITLSLKAINRHYQVSGHKDMASEEKTYYSASILFQSLIDGSNDESSIWEEQIVLIRASSEDEARLRAEEYAKKEEIAYKNHENSTVEWKFFKIERMLDTGLHEMPEIIEIFSRFLKGAEVKSLLTPF